MDTVVDPINVEERETVTVSAAKINARIRKSENNNPGNVSPINGMGETILQYCKQYNVNPAVVVAVMQRECQLGADGSKLPTEFYNFGGLTAGGDGGVPGTCGSQYFIDRYWKVFCTPKEGLKGQVSHLNESHYRATDGTLAGVMEIYAPKHENDWANMFEIFREVGNDLGVTINENTPVYTGVNIPSNSGDSGGGGTFSFGNLDQEFRAFGFSIAAWIIALGLIGIGIMVWAR